MQLYVDSNFLSPYAMFVFVALREKNKAYFEITPINLTKNEHKQGEFAKLSMTQKIPMYVEGDLAINESIAILEYIEEKHDARPALPTNAEDRAIARQLQNWFRTDLYDLRKERPSTVVFYKKSERPAPAPLSEQAKDDATKLISVANKLVVDGKKFLFDEWSVVDVELSFMLQRLIKAGDDVPENLVKYANFQWQRPSVQWWATQKRPPLTA